MTPLIEDRPSTTGSRIVGVACGAGAGALWGLVFLAPELARAFSPLQLTVGRYLAYGLIALALLAPRCKRVFSTLEGRDWRALFWLSLMGNTLYYSLLSSAVQIGGMAMTALVIGFLPLAVTLIGSRDEGAASLNSLAPSLLLCAAGAVCIGWQALAGPSALSMPARLIGLGCAVGALASWTCFAVGNARALKRLVGVSVQDWNLLTGVVTGAQSLLLAPVAFWALGSHQGGDWSVFLAVSIGVAVLASIVGNGLWNQMSRLLPLTLVGQMILFETLFALIYGLVWEHRAPTLLERPIAAAQQRKDVMTEARTEEYGKGIALRIAAAGSFSVMAAVLKLASFDGVVAPEMLFYRAFFGLPVVLFWVMTSQGGLKALGTRRPWAHVTRSVIGITSILCVFQTLTILPLADATTISFTAPIFATILSYFILKEAVGPRRWAAVAVGFIGVIIVMRPGAGDQAAPPLIGIGFGLAAAFLTAAVTITLRQLRGTEHVASIVFWFFVASSIVGALLLPFVGAFHQPSTYLLLIGSGLAGGLAQLFMTASLKAAPVAVVAPFDYLQIVGAVAFGWWLMDTTPTLNTVAGASLIAASGLYTAWREHVRRKASLIQPTAPPV
ncbi:hypothetical protein LTR94_024557 [Friedmanniomyces endolithicus]|nr:hypothetical protein LTR94_024557 [Friedmanniomyces endolithicus]